MTQIKSLNIWLPTIKAGSGSDVYTIRLSEALKKKGFNVKITWFKHYYEFFPFLCKRKKPPNTNIIIANSWSAFAFKESSIPLISIAHHCIFDHLYSKLKSIPQRIYHNNLIYYYEKKPLSKSELIIAVSQYTANSYKKTFSKNKIQVVYNWIDTNTFIPKKNNRSKNKVRLLFIGNWSQRKGVHIIPAIMRALGEQYELICTTGMRNNHSKHKLPSNIKFIGHLEKQASLVELYQSADLLLYPSLLEGFGYAPLEAHACGIPVVASNSSAIPEVVKDGETGILCPVNDIDSYISAIKYLSENKKVREQMGIKARKRAVAYFSEEQGIKQFIKQLESII